MSILSSPIDPKLATAILRNSANDGSIRSNLHTGELVFVPFKYQHDGAVLLPLADTYGGMNVDNSGTYIYIGTSNAQWLSTSTIRGYFRGRSFGVRFEPSITFAASGAAHSDFGVMIDRVAYKVPKQAFDPVQQARSVDPSGSYGVVVTRDLDDGLHFFEISTRIFFAKSTAIYFFGLLLEKSAGYREPQNYAMRCDPYTLTTSAVRIMSGFTSAWRTPRGISEITYYNPTGGAITVTWSLNAVVYYSFSVAAGASQTFSHSHPIAGNHFTNEANNYLHVGSASGLIVTAVGV